MLMELIEKRRSIRSYLPKEVEQSKLDAVIEAFRKAPSARNGQDWKLVLVKDASLKEKLSAATNDNPFLLQAPVVLVGVGTGTDVMRCGHRKDSINLSIAFSFAMLEACEQGLGTCWLASFDEAAVKEALGIPDDCSVPVVMPVGYAAEEPEAKPRKPVKEVLVIDHM